MTNFKGLGFGGLDSITLPKAGLYQYGHEILCSVRRGFSANRS
jgi:hypothetical protein